MDEKGLFVLLIVEIEGNSFPLLFEGKIIRPPGLEELLGSLTDINFEGLNACLGEISSFLWAGRGVGVT